MKPELTHEQSEALQKNHGFLRGSSYVLISIDKYREMMGVGSDDELARSLEAIDDAMADLNAGNTISLEEAQRRLNEKYGVHS
jgi:hypothetical protein